MARHRNLQNAETLIWIARTGTFRAAAEKLFTTQPAISARMRELENSLGVTLFEKRGRNLELTLAARQFIERVEPLLNEVDHAFTIIDPNQDSLNVSGIVRVGMGEITMTWFTRVFADIRKKMPRLSVEIELDLAFQLKQKLRQGDLDMAIVAGPVEDGRFISRPIGSTAMIWVVASSLLQDEFGRRKTLDQMLSSMPLWCVSRSSEYSVAAQHILRKHGANLDNINTCNHLVALIDLVERGAGIGQLPRIMVSDKLISGKLEILSELLEETLLNFYVVCHKDRVHPAIDYVMDAAVRQSQHVLNRTPSRNLHAEMPVPTR